MTNTSKKLRRAALMGSTAAVAASFALGLGVTPVSAQDADESTEFEEVVVTGSRIKNANISSPSPVTTVGAAEIAIRGNTQIEDMLTTLPQTVAAVGDGDFYGDGTAKVDLRGLGPERTLVLVDGRRLPYGQANATAADLNSIPSMLVQRVDILTGGASAVYGADAVAGVVNFIMKRDFEGISIDGQMSINQADNDSDRFKAILEGGDQPVPGSKFDGFTWSTDLILGANTADGRGNVTVAFNYREANEIRQSDRDYAACAFGGGDPEYYCLGSSTTSPARFASFGLANTNQFDLIPFDPTTGESRNYQGSGSPNDTFNFAATQRTRAPSERFALTVFSHYDLSDNVELYLDFSYTSNTTQGQVGPSGSFFNPSQLNCDNPFLSDLMVEEICTKNGLSGDDIATAFVGKRNVEGGPRQMDNYNDTFRITGGFRGDLNDAWTYDVNGQFAKVKNGRMMGNELIVPRMQKALLVGTDPVTGEAVCKSVLDGSDPLCVPWNIFQPDGVTQEALNYISVPTFREGRVVQKIVNATFTGDLGQYGVSLPWAEDGVQFVGGLEYRSDHLERNADDFVLNDLMSGSGGIEAISETVTVAEFFGELAIPLIQGAEFAEELSATAAFRWSDYNTTGTSNTWALGLTWQPVSDVRIRAQVQQAVRAPNIFELYLSQDESLFDLTDPDGDGVFDPCAGSTPQYTQAQCALQGVTASQYGNVSDNPAGQFNSITGGNPNLEVEKSKTYTLGAVFTPSAIDGLNISVDYFNIKVKDFIGTIPANLSLSKCSLEGDPFYCSLIQRDAGGGLWVNGDTSYVLATNINTGSIKTDGLDINLGYNFDLPEGWGTMNLSYVASYIMNYKVVALPGEPAYQCAGYYSGECLIPRPEYGHRMLATWTTDGGIGVNFSWRQIGKTKLFGAPDDSTSQNAEMKTINYFDIAVNKEIMEGVSIRAGINNILGTRPPVTSSLPAGLGTGNTYPGLYDVDMRYAFVGFTADF
ncbi:TonB-dependent receptor [Kordiimonas sediminis]|uniref:TonB-dependent receptor n=1 Tax=Kordiimonas sediminis TaxID=1735581 RepID=A0A919AHS5_9PROT|nr:TonB-dependent receptor [Kordiimonas sediminis]GHF10344.1 TonB-dependent receptor [Kordiimonas sediminis]